MNIRKEIAIEAIEETLKFYLESYNPRQNKLSINLFNAYEEYQQDNTICKKSVRGLHKLNLRIFRKDKNRPYVAKNIATAFNPVRNQGYNITELGEEFFIRVLDKIKDIEGYKMIKDGELQGINKAPEYFTTTNNNFKLGTLYGQIDDISPKYIIENKGYKIEDFGREYSSFSFMKKELRDDTNTPYEIDMKSSSFVIYSWLFNYIGYKMSPEDIKRNEGLREIIPGYIDSSAYSQKDMEAIAMFKHYSKDSDNVRQNLSYDLRAPVSEIKTLITTILNGGAYNTVKELNNNTLWLLYKGSTIVRDRILKWYKEMKNINPDANLVKFVEIRAKNKISIFYFIMEFIEGKIRDEMTKYLFQKYPNIQINRVHDALYLSQELTTQDKSTLCYVIGDTPGLKNIQIRL